jgi:hypothetical protein
MNADIYIAYLIGCALGLAIIGVICFLVCRWQDWRQARRWRGMFPQGIPKR